jgi:hypothetical protein
VLSTLIELDGATFEVTNTHVPNGSGNGWRRWSTSRRFTAA